MTNGCSSLGPMAYLGDLLAQLDEDNVLRGRQFERICKWFLTNDPLYPHGQMGPDGSQPVGPVIQQTVFGVHARAPSNASASYRGARLAQWTSSSGLARMVHR
jgi:hypothetical protein